jgi:hypothetical protein
VFLQGTIKPFIVKIELNWRQVRWAEILAEYYFEIEYIKGTDNIRADILSKKVKL